MSWLAPGAGRGVVQLDLVNCSSVESALSLDHPRTVDDVGAIAAREQDSAEGSDLIHALVPFWMVYADGVERVAAESILERQRWVTRIWYVEIKHIFAGANVSSLDSREAINSPRTVVSIPSIASPQTRSRSPTASIRTILSIDSRSSRSSGTGSRSTVFVPPLSEVPDIDDFYATQSDSSATPKKSSSSSSRYESLSGSSSFQRRSSLLSSFHTRTVDDTVISGQDYLYRGDPRAITAGPRRRVSGGLRRSGSMTDMDADFASNRYSTSSSNDDDENFFSADSGTAFRSSLYSYASGDSRGLTTTATPSATLTTTGVTRFTTTTTATTDTHGITSTDSHRDTTSASLLGDSHGSGSYTYTSGYTSGSPYTSLSTYRSGSPYTSSSQTPTSPSRTSLSRTREVRRRGGASGRTSSRTFSSSGGGSYSVTEEGSDKENISEGSYSGSYSYSSGSAPTPDSGSYTRGTGSETGYDVCPSSDMSDMTICTSSSSGTPYSSSSSPPASSVAMSASTDQFVTASQGSSDYVSGSEYVSAKEPSEVDSFESFPTIPSLYSSAEEGSWTYHTASEPSTEYTTAQLCPSESQLEEIPSEQSTPKQLSSLDLWSDDDGKSVAAPPSVIPSISSPSSVSDILPQDVPLPPSVPSSITMSPSSLTTLPSPLEESESSSDVPTPSSLQLSSESSSSFPSSVSTSSFPASTSGDLLNIPTSIPSSTVTPSTISTESSLGIETSLSLPSPSIQTSASPGQWARETNLSYESSMLEPSPSVMSVALHEGPDTSFETSLLRPSGSFSSLDRMTTIPETPSVLTSARGVSYPSITPLLPERPLSSTQAEPTPSSLSVITSSSSSLVRTPSSVSSSSIVSQSSISSSVFDSRSVIREMEEREPTPPSPSTEPSLLTTPRSSPRPVSFTTK